MSYPRILAPWLDAAGDASVDDDAPAKWVELCASTMAGSFDVRAIDGTAAVGLDLGDALVTFWERVSFHLVDDLDDAMALHAAALVDGSGLVLMPGQSGAGKSCLSMWYRAQGLDFCSDEIVSFAPLPGGGISVAGALMRPVILKTPVDPAALMRPAEPPVLEQPFSGGVLLRLPRDPSLAGRPIHHGLVLFPHFQPGALFRLTPLTPGEACLRLIASCLNARNLPRGGLSIASLLARGIPAVALNYGSTGQLAGRLDVFTRRVLAAPIPRDDFASLCAAFNAHAREPAGPAASPATTAQASRNRPAFTMTPAIARPPRRLTIGMATYEDYDGVYFTVQSLRINNPEIDGTVEFLVVDNHPDGPSSDALRRLEQSIDGYRYVPCGNWTGTAVRDLVFAQAGSPLVLCVDSHVLVAPGAASKLISYLEAHPDSRDLLQGPMIYDDLLRIATHLEPRWRAGMYGVWAEDPRGADPAAPVFEIPMQGMGLFACHREAWVGFNPRFRGFGGEEGYIHEKMRRRGGRTLCLPFLRWVHRFDRPLGTPYPNRWHDRMRNYMIGFTELGLDTSDMEAHFATLLGAETSARMFAEIKREAAVSSAPDRL